LFSLSFVWCGLSDAKEGHRRVENRKKLPFFHREYVLIFCRGCYAILRIYRGVFQGFLLLEIIAEEDERDLCCSNCHKTPFFLTTRNSNKNRVKLQTALKQKKTITVENKAFLNMRS